MIFTLLAALIGAAQERYDFMEGTQTEYRVDFHNGNNYTWSVIDGLNSVDYDFITAPVNNEVLIRWNVVGDYTLRVMETDVHGCSTIRELLINVISNNRSIAFTTTTSSGCYNEQGNGFGLPVRILDNGGVPLNAADFPVDVEFAVNGTAYTQQILYDQQVLSIDASWFAANSQLETNVLVQLTSARDKQGVNIPLLSGGDVHTRSIRAIPQLEFIYVDDVVNELSYGNYEASISVGEPENADYHWFIEPSDGTSTDMTVISSATADIFWDGPVGFYTLGVSVRDGNGCFSDTIRQVVEVQKNDPAPIPVYAGPDTTIGACQTYPFDEVYPTDDYLSYQWEPAQYLSDPTIPNPVFTPGETTTFVLTVTTLLGYNYSDTVTISVSDVIANAGDDVMIGGTNLILDGSGSSGQNLSYSWTTNNGQIVSGENTPYPEVSEPGIYYLEVRDEFACSSIDSVIVTRYANAPIANNDYDTTNYYTPINIDVLANDYDPDGDISPETLTITQYPLNGTVDIDYFDYTINYTPNENYTGTDVFEYEICDNANLCDNANVYVLVTTVNFFIPEAFTPNGDNINDFFEIVGIEYYPNNKLTIINRWGKKVFEANKYGIETSPLFWDGTLNAEGGSSDVPSGTYFYVLDLGNGEKPIAGSVYIDR